MSLENAPDWWNFELELSPHVEERMIDRDLPGDIMKRLFLTVTYRHGRPIGVETTDPSRFDPDRFLTLLESLGQPAIDRDELRPLAAA